MMMTMMYQFSTTNVTLRVTDRNLFINDTVEIFLWWWAQHPKYQVQLIKVLYESQDRNYICIVYSEQQYI